MTEHFERWTARAQQVLSLAQEEARAFQHNYIGTEHLLLGLVLEGEGLAGRALSTLGVEAAPVRAAVERIVGRGTTAVAGELPLTPRVKRVLTLATDEAARLQHQFIGTEHLLLGLLREGEGVGAGIIASLAAPLPQVREELYRELAVNQGTATRTIRDRIMIALGRPASAAGGAKGNVITCRLDDRDLAALDALVEAGIRSTRSDAASWLIHAGIDAHQELFEQVYTTVSEIRQLRRAAQAIAARHTTGAAAPPDDAPPTG